MIPSEIWRKGFTDAKSALETVLTTPQIVDKCVEFSNLLVKTLRDKGNVFSCGNGGSHCDAMHFAEELTGRYRKERRPLGALALGDPSHLTCTANDYGFEYVFERQLRGLARSGDLLLAISTSGNSKNVIRAVHAARELGLKSVALLGKDGGELKNLVDVALVVPGATTDRIQELHIKVIHLVIETMERELFPENYR